MEVIALLAISIFSTLIELKDFLGRIHHCFTVFRKWIFDSNFPFSFLLTCENLDYCCTNDNETKGINAYKVVLKYVRFFPTEKKTGLVHK